MEGGEVSPTDTEHGHREGRGEGRGRGGGGEGRRREGGKGMGGDGRGQEGMEMGQEGRERDGRRGEGGGMGGACMLRVQWSVKVALSTCKYSGGVVWQSLTIFLLPPLPLSSRTTLRM